MNERRAAFAPSRAKSPLRPILRNCSDKAGWQLARSERTVSGKATDQFNREGYSHMKKSITLSLVLAASLGLAACGEKKADEAAAPEATTEATTEGAADGAMDAAAGAADATAAAAGEAADAAAATADKAGEAADKAGEAAKAATEATDAAKAATDAAKK
jgi:hypothetical protein